MNKVEEPQIPLPVLQTLPQEAQGYILALQTFVQTLQTQIAELKAQLAQNSQNSSKPPSADPPWERPPKKGKEKATAKPKGGQVGHPKHQRKLVPPEGVDNFIELRPTHCANLSCTAPLRSSDQLGSVQCHQVVELPAVKVEVTEYQFYAYECSLCQRTTTHSWPTEVPRGQFGPNLLATVAILHGQYQLSLRQVQAVAEDLWQLPLSLGALADACAKTSQALAPAYREVEQHIQQVAPCVHVDETGWYKAGQLEWLWVAVAPIATLFAIKPGRSKAELNELIGPSYAGFVHSDRLRLYLSLEATRHQLCWAHLRRNLQGLAQRDGPAREWGEEMLDYSHQLFSVWHRFLEREGSLSRQWLLSEVEPIRTEFKAGLARGQTLPDGKVKAFCRQLLKVEERLYLFVKEAGVSPTNNTAERALRPAVIWRKKCYGNQSAKGEAFVERVLSLAATCQQQGRNFLAFVRQSLLALGEGQPAPPLLNLTFGL